MARKIATCLTALILTGLWYHKVLFSQNLAILGTFRNVEAVEKDFPWNTVVGYKTLKWQGCYEHDFQCARLLVPLNHSDPEGEQAGIALIRKRATVPPPLYRGPILINPGGPGESGVDTVRIAGRLVSTVVGPQFDIVGFDPRGVARSQPRVSFFKTEVERELWRTGVNLITGSPESVGRAWARSHVLGRLTAENDDGYLRHINTDQTARDMLRIVEAHGRTKLQYWGFSYGTVLGATFAAMFPDKVERIILDGVVDAENYYASLWSNNLSDTDKSMDQFYTGCANAGPDNCAFWAPTPDDIRKNLTALYDSVRTQPKPVRTKSGYGIVDYKTLHSAVFESLYHPYASFPELARGLAALAAGDGSLIFDMMNPPPFECPCGSPELSFARVDDGVAAIHCNDGDEVPSDLESMQEYVDMMTKSSPNWGGAWSRIRMECVGWPKFPKSHFQGPFEANTSHPILLIGNTADPVTPLALATKMSHKFPGSVVLTQDSGGHCSVAAPSICTMKYIGDYFVNGQLPDYGTVCQTETGPFPVGTGERNNGDDSQSIFVNMSSREKGLYDAIMDFVNTPYHGRSPMSGLLALPHSFKAGARCSV